MCGELGVEKDEDIRKGGRTPSNDVFSQPAVTAAAAVFHRRLTAGASSVRRGVHRDELVLTILFVTVHTIA